MNNGLLYRYNPNADSDEAQLIAPEHEWSNILSAYHDNPMAGHYGAEKIFQRISQRYCWKGMQKYIEGYVRNCITCQRYKPSNMKLAGLLQTSAMNKIHSILISIGTPRDSSDYHWSLSFLCTCALPG
ncbi:unnamed protein product [Arctia plantaginis]|uniref:Integrase zinc-binding domain-containing protein n=1 Tax=Arctia plantaginis TaxID=874455 RepID=A0A8S1AD58_ARCPL|nr:unnamed protein product [Arctia plantaginis]